MLASVISRHPLADASVATRTRIYVVALVLAACGLAIGLVYAGYDLDEWWAVLVLAALAAGAERRSVRLSNAAEISISLVPTLAAAVAFGPLAGMLTGGASMLGGLRTGFTRWAVYTCTRA